MGQWDRFADQQRGRIQRAFGFENTLEVYTVSESYTYGEGYTGSDSEHANSPIDAEITRPEDAGERDAGGTTAEADVVIIVPDDTGITWQEYGDEGEGGTEVVDTDDSTRYRIETVTTEHNGLLRLEGVEL